MSGVDLADPLRSLIPSLDSAVLEVLAGTESGLSATQIARLARRGTRQGHVPVLERLVEHGLVLAEPANRGSLYRFNREHVLAPSVLSALAARRVVLERLTAELSQLEPSLVHASVFGSFARAETGPDSDIDLLLVAERDADIEVWTEQIHELEDAVLAWTGNRLEWLAMTMAGLRRAKRNGEPLVRSLLDEAQPLLGSELRDVLGGRVQAGR